MHDQPDPQGEEIEIKETECRISIRRRIENIRFPYANQVSRRSNSRIIRHSELQVCQNHARSCIGAFTRN